ncbi:undecaprenyl-phosphate glucose phosphotransferase [uncultured Enterovirga sp.]|uniref:undecaprenyl-phosphate glucose phosphotransferase n=1 Tax=uncultured Enterovirga sp. TaxID=2026352 RepID=UPI0035CB5F43
MSVIHSVEHRIAVGRSPRAELFRHVVGPASLAFAALAIMAAALLSWLVWGVFPFAQPSSLGLHMRLGFGTALLVVIFTVVRNEHRLAFHAAGENTPGRTGRIWNMAVFVLFVMAFLTRRAEDLSRGTVILFYFSGFLALWSARSLTSRAIQAASKVKAIVAQRILVVGTEDGIAAFLRRDQPWNLGFEVVGTVSVTPDAAGTGRSPSPDLLRAVDLAREMGIDDVYIAVPWSETETIDLCVEAFLNTPIAIHLAPERVLDRFDQVAISRVGAMASLELTRPMSPAAVGTKRVVDMVLAGLALLALSPIFLVVAIAIRLDSPGPVFFLQTRYGFNQRRFRIVKFRTMRTYADSGDVPQASRQDPRVTRVGRWLRRTNVDELPQLINVLAGQMSLVGPRPHAVPHNTAYERRIALYARRHNVRPGITGWAQVNGLRGETDTDEKMKRRIDHDLYYIDNWSMLFDLRIMLKTLFSAASYRNAY